MGFLRELAAVSRVVDDPDVLEGLRRDESGIVGKPPLGLVRPRGPAEAARVLEICSKYKVPVVPRGAGTSLTGGAIPLFGGVVLSSEAMNRVLEVSAADMVAVVEPGVITGEFQRLVEGEGLFYPPDPASLDSCTLGGNVAENAGGPRAIKYGITGHWVLGLEVALPGGGLLFFGRRTPKGVTGYSLERLFLASEGTLGFITKIWLRLIPKPPEVATLLALFRDELRAGKAVEKLLASGILPRVLEFVDQGCLGLMGYGAGAGILVETDGTCAWEEAQRAGELLEGAGGRVLVALDEAQRERLWKGRRALATLIRERWPHRADEDISVPRSKIPNFLTGARKLLGELGLRGYIFGHAGDGNLHVIVAWDEPEMGNRVPELRRGLARLALSLGGSITAEHGVGAAKRELVRMELGREVVELQRRIKAVFDPTGIMNPGKKF